MGEERDMEKLLWRLGANYSYAGFGFIVSAVELIRQDRKVLQYITKGVYLTVAAQNRTSVKCVERNIRTVIEAVWRYGNRKLLDQVAGRPLSRRPNNREFLEMLTWYEPEDENL